jgi:hypothetical protein
MGVAPGVAMAPGPTFTGVSSHRDRPPVRRGVACPSASAMSKMNERRRTSASAVAAGVWSHERVAPLDGAAASVFDISDLTAMWTCGEWDGNAPPATGVASQRLRRAPGSAAAVTAAGTPPATGVASHLIRAP